MSNQPETIPQASNEMPSSNFAQIEALVQSIETTVDQAIKLALVGKSAYLEKYGSEPKIEPRKPTPADTFVDEAIVKILETPGLTSFEKRVLALDNAVCLFVQKEEFTGLSEYLPSVDTTQRRDALVRLRM